MFRLPSISVLGSLLALMAPIAAPSAGAIETCGTSVEAATTYPSDGYAKLVPDADTEARLKSTMQTLRVTRHPIFMPFPDANFTENLRCDVAFTLDENGAPLAPEAACTDGAWNESAALAVGSMRFAANETRALRGTRAIYDLSFCFSQPD